MMMEKGPVDFILIYIFNKQIFYNCDDKSNVMIMANGKEYFYNFPPLFLFPELMRQGIES